MPVPNYDNTVRPKNELPHPSRPWSYQIIREEAAKANGDLFIHGAWYRFNMYEVDKAEYSKLEKLISTDEIAQKWLDEIKESESGRIYIDCDVNPRAVIIVKDNNECYKLGEGKDCQFEEGLKWFYEQQHLTMG